MSDYDITDVQYYRLSVLIESKQLEYYYLQAIDRWLRNSHTATGGWVSTAELIGMLESFPDRTDIQYVDPDC